MNREAANQEAVPIPAHAAEDAQAADRPSGAEVIASTSQKQT
jgi:hypothetical protein